jgi:CheY-like chemotaxis protein
MSPNALLMCHNPHSLQILEAAFCGTKVEPTVCSTTSQAIEALIPTRYSALVLDFDIPGAAEVARLAATEQLQPKPVLFALIGPLTPVGSAFQAGANFALYKPLDPEQVMHSVRAGRGFMRQERRKAARQGLQTLAHVKPNENWMPALLLNVSEQGVLLQAPFPISSANRLPLRFQLPGTTCLIETSGSVIWSDRHGKAGMFFTRLSPASKKALQVWLEKRGADRKDAVRVLLEPQSLRRAARAHA